MISQNGDKMVELKRVRYRVGNSQILNKEGTATYVHDFTVYIDGIPGTKTGIPRCLSEIEFI